ncbi:DUF2637 domain-containing protein [Allosaccharopolyspora coralli]|uniref:DUF2637 domain-containing protein n=1 Tax=Allosaccharopolyspora coralli TaxID=2665642 RepID=A0A5Q3QCA2_9PSEU|nr:DUF2637 domain-containing protein [Allosaccharopolyspora coralli]QGK69159.1 DUF2637 domain-containing protein [Allosaccharopolyspora coralli]
MDTDQDSEDLKPSRAHRWLAPVSLLIVAFAAVMGWAASFVGLHAYGQHAMAGFGFWTAWLLPATFDGAAFACTLMTYRSAIHGRSAARGRALMWAFTAVSAWINWIHQPTPDTRLVAAGLPVAAVAVFDVVLGELRADYEARHGRQAFRLRPGLLALRWLVDRTGTASAFRQQITGIPVAELAGLAASPATTEAASTTPTPPVAPAAPAAPSGVKLPADMVEAIRHAHHEATQAGREFTAADVRAVVKVPEAMAERIATDLHTRNGHALTS